MRIKDICSGVTDGSHNPPQGLENSDYLMLSSKNVFDDKITFDSPRYLSQIDFEQESKRTRIKSGDVLLTIVGTVGRAAVVGENMPQFTLQRSVAVLHPNVEICDSRYLMYALQANRNHIESRAKGVAQKGIYLKEVADIELQIPLLSEQTHRVKVLDKIAFVIKFHQKQLQKLDELVKARFVELFGDTVLNPFGWEKALLSTVCDVRDGTHDSPSYYETGYPLVTSKNVSSGKINLTDCSLICESDFKKINERSKVDTGDIIMPMIGTIGKPVIVDTLMTKGIKIDYGNKLGKTIIFAKNHDHAEKILEVFNKEYPHLPGFAKVIDNYMTYAQSAIDEFSDPKKLPQIAISVDMLDTGIDVPEVLNLVFFKKVMSKAKFWQMIGRGTRLCPALLDGKDKDKFYIFDFCGNFEFFRMSKGKPTANMIALQGAIFHLKAQIAFKLQDLAYQTTDLIAFRKALVDDMVRKVQELNKDNFAVRQHLKYVELYANADNYAALTYEDTLLMGQELAPLITPEEDDPKAMRFDALMYGIELAYLAGKKYGKARSDLMKKVAAVASVANIPEIMAQSDLLNKILHTDYLETAGINEFEHIRENLRDLIKYIPIVKVRYDTNFDDAILSEDWNESELENDDLKNYKAKAEFYVRQHTDNAVIAKLKGNIPLNSDDVKALEEILWNEVGTKQDYEAEYGQKPLGEFVREIVGLDMNAAKEAFAQYLNDASLDSRQIYFVNQIVEYIVHNGMMKDLSVLQEAPFTDHGSIVEVFTDLSVWMGIRQAIERVNANAVAA